jgi:16S rRNA (uracil1498-N3)-methyltransferase
MNSAFFQRREGDLLIIEDPEEFHHLVNVLRTRKSEKIRLIDGFGLEFICELHSIDIKKKRVEAKIIEEVLNKRELSFKITLAFSPLQREEANDLIVQKGTELGVSEFVPLLCDRTLKKNVRIERWLKIIREAVKQSGRCVLPELSPLVTLEDFVNSCESSIKLFGLIDGPNVSDVCISGNVALVIGPEGDFTSREIEILKRKGFIGVGLTPTILKAETAAILLGGFVAIKGGTNK